MSQHKVSVREARENFRRLLDQVQAGDEVIILRRDVEVARLAGPQRSRARLPDLDSLRASVKMGGQPLSRIVVQERKPSRGAARIGSRNRLQVK
ncbi:MAG: type II toxin-antitoxin system Phd/YefM family antitoxin [Terriglobia bacterium]